MSTTSYQALLNEDPKEDASKHEYYMKQALLMVSAQF